MVCFSLKLESIDFVDEYSKSCCKVQIKEGFASLTFQIASQKHSLMMHLLIIRHSLLHYFVDYDKRTVSYKS